MTSPVPSNEQLPELRTTETVVLAKAPPPPPEAPPLPGGEGAVVPSGVGAGAVILGALAALWVSLGSIWKGKSVEAFRLGSSTKNFWVIGFLCYAVILGLLTATLAVRSVGNADEFLGSMTDSIFGYSSSGMLRVSLGSWMQFFFSGIILALVALVLRALCLKWTFSLRRAPQSVGSVANIITTAYVVQLAVLFVATVFLIIPSAVISGLVMLLLGIISIPLVLISEVLIYIGLNRAARLEKSALIPHAVFTGVWIALTITVYVLMLTVTLENAF